MRRFLYISPFFPPHTRVGALRPLKFLRHLENHGWGAVVLSEVLPGEPSSPELFEAVPESTIVVPNYRRRGPPSRTSEPASHEEPPSSWWARHKPEFLRNPELFPIQTELPRLPHATKAALRVVDEHPDIEAVMVNASPYGAMLVGATVARRRGLPLIQDLRDPWSICSLRRPKRPRPSQWFVEQLERRAFAPARRILVNTRNATAEYRAAYPGMAERFVTLRNHHDAELMRLAAPEDVPPLSPHRVSLLFLGRFRRHLEGEPLVDLLARLASRGLRDRVRLVVTGTVTETATARAEALGVKDMITRHPFVPYSSVGPVLDAADVLVALDNDSDQRVPAKIYDYASTRRPVLSLSDNPEVMQLALENEMACFRLDELDSAADWLAQLCAQGRPPHVRRDGDTLSSRSASARLAEILEEVAGGRRFGRGAGAPRFPKPASTLPGHAPNSEAYSACEQPTS